MDSQKLYRYVRQAADRYRLIDPGDKIAVGISGGKDSLVLLYALAGIQRFYPVPFSLIAITADLGFGMCYDDIAAWCSSLSVPYHIEHTHIGQIVFSEKKSKNSCSLCANLRRGALVNAAKACGCTKLALGHHNDDFIQTMMMSMLYEGRFYSFSPYTLYADSKLALIRPLVYVKEGEIRSFAQRMQFPVLPNRCPNDGHSARNDMKEMLSSLSSRYPDAKKRLFSAIEHSPIEDWKNARERGNF